MCSRVAAGGLLAASVVVLRAWARWAARGSPALQVLRALLYSSAVCGFFYQAIWLPTVIWLSFISVTLTGMSAKMVARAMPVAARAMPEYSLFWSKLWLARAVPVKLSGRDCLEYWSKSL